MRHSLSQSISDVLVLLPSSPQELEKTLTGYKSREPETISGVTEFLEQLGFRIQEIFNNNGLDLSGDDPEISEFRHMQKNLGVRMNQVENSLNRGGKRSYEWIDVFRSNIRSLQVL